MSRPKKTDHPIITLLGSNLKAIREMCGFSLNQAEEAANLSTNTLTRWEKNVCTPDIAKICTLAELYGLTSIDGLVGYNGKTLESCLPDAETESGISSDIGFLTTSERELLTAVRMLDWKKKGQLLSLAQSLAKLQQYEDAEDED